MWLPAVGGPHVRLDSRSLCPDEDRASRAPGIPSGPGAWGGARSRQHRRSPGVRGGHLLPPAVLVGSTGVDGSIADTHDVSNVLLTTDAVTLPTSALPESSLPLGPSVVAARPLVGLCAEAPGGLGAVGDTGGVITTAKPALHLPELCAESGDAGRSRRTVLAADAGLPGSHGRGSTTQRGSSRHWVTVRTRRERRMIVGDATAYPRNAR